MYFFHKQTWVYRLFPLWSFQVYTNIVIIGVPVLSEVLLEYWRVVTSFMMFYAANVMLKIYEKYN